MPFIKKILIVISILFWAGFLVGQGYYIGIRAGTNYTKFNGPSEMGAREEFKTANGIHFGLGLGYKLNDLMSIKTEIMYTQNGSKYEFEGDSYYPFLLSDGVFIVYDSLDLKMDISNAYLHVPLTFNIQTLGKYEFYGGAYVNFMISPIGTGILKFGGRSKDSENHQFEQGQDHRYFSDRAGESAPFAGQIFIIVDERDVNIPSLVGGYYNFSNKVANTYHTIDFGLVGGFNYYLNRGLYLGLRVEYGLRDVTNNRMDVSRTTLNLDESYVFREDNDRHIGLNLSLGFKF